MPPVLVEFDSRHDYAGTGTIRSRGEIRRVGQRRRNRLFRQGWIVVQSLSGRTGRKVLQDDRHRNTRSSELGRSLQGVRRRNDVILPVRRSSRDQPRLSGLPPDHATSAGPLTGLINELDAGALLRGSKTDPQRPRPRDPSTTDSVRRRPPKLSHLIEDVTCEDGLSLLPRVTARSKALRDDRRVPEEGVLHAGLLTVARVLRPLSPSNLLHLPDRVVARGRSWSPSSHCGRPGRWNDNRRATRTRSRIDAHRVGGRVRREAGDVALDRVDQDRGPSSRRQHARPSGRARRSRPTRRRPDGASSSHAYRGCHFARRPMHLRLQSRARYCRREDGCRCQSGRDAA